VVTAVRIAQDYATDPAAFDKSYKDKVVVVTGKVELPKAHDVLAKKDWVTLVGFTKKGDPAGTVVRFEATKAFESLKAGQSVAVRGTVQGHDPTRLAVELADAKPEAKH
jgi:hypothetical protein